MTVCGVARSVTVGACTTPTVTERLMEPPSPVQVSRYVAVFERFPVAVLPETGLLPLHAPPALQLDAFVALQFNVALDPTAMDAGVEVKFSVGAGVGLPAMLPSSPQETSTSGSNKAARREPRRGARTVKLIGN